MKKNTIIRALAGTLLAATALSATAKVLSTTVGFVTIKDVELTQTQAITYGQNILGKALTACDAPVDISGTFAVTNLTGGSAVDTTMLPVPSLEGVGCGSASTGALSGVYRIVGNSAQQVTITVASVSGGEFDFSPAGYLVSAADSTGDPLIAFFADTPKDFTSTTTDTGILVGGTLTIGAADLIPNTPYSTSFDITATY
jgi:hypothetical protein